MSRIKWKNCKGPNSRGLMSKPVIANVGKPVKHKDKKKKISDKAKKLKGNAGLRDFCVRKNF